MQARDVHAAGARARARLARGGSKATGSCSSPRRRSRRSSRAAARRASTTSIRSSDVALRAPILRPPSIRLFDDAHVRVREHGVDLRPRRRGAVPAPASRPASASRPSSARRSEIAGYTLVNDWRAPSLAPPKDRDFATSVGPVDRDRTRARVRLRRRERASRRGTRGSAPATSSSLRRSPIGVTGRRRVDGPRHAARRLRQQRHQRVEHESGRRDRPASA